MPGSYEPESAWYMIDQVENWMETLQIQEKETQLMVSPSQNRETGEWQMDLYGRYNGDQDFEYSFEASVDYSKLNMDYKEIMEEFQLWENMFEESFDDAELYFWRPQR